MLSFKKLTQTEGPKSVIFFYFEFMGRKKHKRDKRVAADLLKAVNIRLFIEPCQLFTTFEWDGQAYSAHV